MHDPCLRVEILFSNITQVHLVLFPEPYKFVGIYTRDVSHRLYIRILSHPIFFLIEKCQCVLLSVA